MLEQKILGIKFRNPVGLSAGFDKNAEIISINEDIGFGFVEVGSITANPSKGNTGKRLERFINYDALWVNLGLNNKGAKEISSNLRHRKFSIPVGISVAKTNCMETTDPKVGLEDYLTTVRQFRDIADYIDLNISCPNAFGGLQFSVPKLYESLLIETDKMKLNKPIFIKLSPDLTRKNIDEIIRISRKHNVSGFICSNLTKKHNLKSGGLSGKAVEGKANQLLKYVYRKTNGKFILIGVGGIFSAEDAYNKIKSGANLVQLITGMVYRGPNLIGEINHDLVALLEKDGYKSIGEAVGSGIKGKRFTYRKEPETTVVRR
jgi:dihydroorotate dehydrogenase